MPTVSRVWADTDGVRITDTDGYYIVIGGDTTELQPPDAPSGLAYDPVTGALSCDWQPDASEVRFYANDYAAGEGAQGLRTTLVDTVALELEEDPATTDGALQDTEWRAYDAAAYDHLYDAEGPPSRPVYAVGDNRRLS